jgi:hypothetical protein
MCLLCCTILSRLVGSLVLVERRRIGWVTAILALLAGTDAFHPSSSVLVHCMLFSSIES